MSPSRLKPPMDVAARTHDVLGEGPLFVADVDRLLWVDILQSRWHALTLSTGAVRTIALEEALTGFAATTGGGYVGAFRSGLALFDDHGAIDRWLHRPEQGMPSNRFNDAGTDPAGRFLAGTMNEDGDGATGKLYALDPSGALAVLKSDIVIANTIAFSPDGRVLYTADSGRGDLGAYRYDPQTGGLGDRLAAFAPHPALPGVPDGSAMDAEGCLWNARWGGGCLVRLTPDGTTDRIAELPVPQPTSCAFVGTRLFITSARFGLSDEDLARYPLSGQLLSFDAGVAGLPRPKFRHEIGA